MQTNAVFAPVSGTVVPLTEVPDQVFSSGMLGMGVGIRPDSSAIVSPVAGQVVTVMPHAYGIRCEDGMEVLVHVGIDTVRLQGEHFTVLAQEGQSVAAGDPLAEADVEAIAAAGFNTVVIIVVTNSKDFASLNATGAPTVQAGETILTAER